MARSLSDANNEEAQLLDLEKKQREETVPNGLLPPNPEVGGSHEDAECNGSEFGDPRQIQVTLTAAFD